MPLSILCGPEIEYAKSGLVPFPRNTVEGQPILVFTQNTSTTKHCLQETAQ